MAGGSVTGLPPYRIDELTTGVNVCAMSKCRFVVVVIRVSDSVGVFACEYGREDAPESS